MTFVTGQHVSAVMADLTTFIDDPPRADRPGRDVLDRARRRRRSSAPIATEDTATILLRFDGGARGAVSISQISPGRKNSLQYEIDGSESALRPGTRSSPTRSGSAIATGPTRSSSATRP